MRARASGVAQLIKSQAQRVCAWACSDARGRCERCAGCTAKANCVTRCHTLVNRWLVDRCVAEDQINGYCDNIRHISADINAGRHRPDAPVSPQVAAACLSVVAAACLSVVALACLSVVAPASLC